MAKKPTTGKTQSHHPLKEKVLRPEPFNECFGAKAPCTFDLIPALTAKMLGHRLLREARRSIPGVCQTN